ncbi:hypothetical protein OSB04_025406 [Centaurea solstitialis]|uniref:Uncharacterized protein n=1 Tax=Centaurea solstitialis TaxID=347529 RepID=A0AA38SN19_9ASTR|nr:hypothetical protein OSB04_025406 [Centaurea solstitialis]
MSHSVSVRGGPRHDASRRAISRRGTRFFLNAHGYDGSHYCADNQEVNVPATLNSTSLSDEVCNTIEIGKMVGFHMDGCETKIRNVVSNKEVRGRSGGIISVWDTACFSKAGSVRVEDFCPSRAIVAAFRPLVASLICTPHRI